MYKVLLVEDEEVLRDVYEIVLRSADAEVTLARDGSEALVCIARDSFDLILLDLMMPVLDGIGFLQAANLPNVSPGTKVIVFSNVSSGGDVTQAMELGADKHVLKSDFTPNDLLDLVEGHRPS